MMTAPSSRNDFSPSSLRYRQYCNEELLEAAQDGHYEHVRQRLVGGCNVNTETPQARKTPLILAAENGHFRVVRLLVEYGADVNYRDRDRNCWTAYQYAVDKGYKDIADYLASCPSFSPSANKKL